tara:strand:+ start:524 stop:751 length:228 start_codon:yes stop_codon:yes gene_type:complete
LRKRNKVNNLGGNPLHIKIKPGQSVERAISLFKRRVKESKLLIELREREHYLKPSVKKRQQKNKAKLRRKKAQEN